MHGQNGWMDRWVDRVGGCMDRMDGWTDGWIEWMDAWTEWMIESMDGQRGWIEGQINKTEMIDEIFEFYNSQIN